MKACPICNAKFFDDMTVCDKCNIQLMDNKIAQELHNWWNDGASQTNILKKYPEECQVILEYKNRQNEKYTTTGIRLTKLPNSERVQPPQQQNLPKCPYCGSTDLNKIGTLGRAVSVGLFGLASGKIGKQWHCKNCGSDF